MSREQREMVGKICMVTGATAGIGQATALLLAMQGATVIGIGRNPAKNQASMQSIKDKTGNSSVEYLLADLSSQNQIHSLAQQFQSKYDRLDVLVNNAGASIGNRQESVDGIEMTFALNHLGYFVLTNLLVDILKASAPSRVINVSSGLHKFGKLDFDDIPMRESYSRSKAYQRSKLANVAFSYEFARRYSNRKITCNAMNPGLVATNVGQNAGKLASMMKNMVDKIAGKTPEEGAQTIIYLATSPDVEGVSGRYFDNEKSILSSKITYNLEFCRRLWELSESLTSTSQEMIGGK